MPYIARKDTGKINKVYYSTMEVANMIGVQPSTIRYWINLFHIFPKRSNRNVRMFSHIDIKRLKKIHYLIHVERYTIEGAIKQLGKIY